MGCFLVVGFNTSGKQHNKASNSFLGFLYNRVGLSEVAACSGVLLNESRHQSHGCDSCPLGGCSVVKSLHQVLAVYICNNEKPLKDSSQSNVYGEESVTISCYGDR